MKQWSRWSLKAEVPQWDMFPELTELLLIGCSIETIWTSKSKLNTLTPKTNSQTCWRREISHVTNGIIFCVFSTWAISILQCALKQWRKDFNTIQEKNESQRSQDQWWIWLREAAKGFHQLCHLLYQKARWKPDKKVKVLRKLRCTMERWDLLFAVTRVTSATDSLKKHTHHAIQNGILINFGLLKSGNLVNWWMIERWDSLFALNEEHTRLKHVSLVNTRTSFWKKKKITNGRLVVCPQRGAPQHFVIEDDEAESDLSLGSRSFLHRVNDQVRKRQKQSSMDATEDSEDILWYGECSCLQHCKHLYSSGRITQTIGIPSRIQKISQWNRCSTYLQNWCLNNQMRSMEWKQLTGKTLHGSNLFLIGDEQDVSLQRHKQSTSFQNLYCVLVRYTRTPDQTQHGKKDWRGSKVHRNAETWTELMVSQWNWSGIFPQNSPHCSSVTKFKIYCWDWEKHQRIFTGRIIFMSMFNDISWRSKDNKKECESNAQQVSLFAGRIGAGQWSFRGPGSEKKWHSIKEDSPQGIWDKIAELMMITFRESEHPVFWATSPLSRAYTSRITIAKMWRTNWKVITTRQIEQILYGCRIPDCCWSRTVFHDERRWRILTIHRCSGLSWVHSAKRRRYIWTEGLDPREHQNWSRLGG